MSSAVGRMDAGRYLFAGALALFAMLACEPKIYPAAALELSPSLVPEIEPLGALDPAVHPPVDPPVPLLADAGHTADGAVPRSTATVEPVTDAGSSGASDASFVVDAGCTPVSLFRDRDGDGFGSTDPEEAVEGCTPAPGYVTRSGDCLDAEPTPANRADLVNPGAVDYFEVGYTTPSAVESFDYDCSGREEAEPSDDFVPAPANCEERATCGLDIGYRTPASPRTGAGVNALCGTRDVVICVDSTTGCGFLQIGGDAFPCR